MKNIFFEIHGSALDSFEVIICKIQISIILVLKVGKLGWIEYVDKDVFTALTCLGFHLEHKVNKQAYTNVFESLLFFVFSQSLLEKKITGKIYSLYKGLLRNEASNASICRKFSLNWVWK